MSPEELFLERYRQVDSSIVSHSEIDLLDSAGRLRQLLLDKTALVHAANTKHRLKFVFRVGEFTLVPDEYTQVLSLEDGLDPDSGRPGRKIKQVNLDGFLGHTILYLLGKPHSVREVIKMASDVAGGVHYTKNPDDQRKLIADFSSQISIGGLPGAVRQLQAIGRVALKGVKPLFDALQAP